MSLCNFPLFSFSFALPSVIPSIPIPDLTISLPFAFPPFCPLD
jgi:hypothetical protein